jgi:hypothetical protein
MDGSLDRVRVVAAGVGSAANRPGAASLAGAAAAAAVAAGVGVACPIRS